MRIVLPLLIMSVPAFGQPASVTAKLPPATAITRNQIACHELVSSNFKHHSSSAAKIRAALTKGSEVFSLHIGDREVRITTKAESKVGKSFGNSMHAVVNSTEVLSAWKMDDQNTISSLLVNKRNGFAVWTRIRASSFLGGGAPELQTVYFTCR